MPQRSPDTGYATALGSYLAVIACYAGTANEACVDLAIELVAEEESEHPGVTSEFSARVEELEVERARSGTFFKLRQARILAEVPQLAEHLEERITIMCEALAEAATDDSILPTLNKVRQAIARS